MLLRLLLFRLSLLLLLLSLTVLSLLVPLCVAGNIQYEKKEQSSCDSKSDLFP